MCVLLNHRVISADASPSRCMARYGNEEGRSCATGARRSSEAETIEEKVGNQIRSGVPARGEKAEAVPCLTRAWKKDEARDKWRNIDRQRNGKAMSR